MPQTQLTDFFTGIREGSSSQSSYLIKRQTPLCFAISPRRSIRRKRRLTIDDVTQMTLDAGQKVIGTQRCEKCGMVYDVDCMKDVNAHDEYHNRFISTKWFHVTFTQIDLWKKKLFFAVVEGGYIFNVRASTTCALKKRLETVVLDCVNEELGYTPDLADVWDKRGLREAWVFISDTEREYPFIAGILLVDSVKEARKLPEEHLKDDSASESLSEVRDNLMGVNRIWVHPCMRRRGIAALLLDRARAHFLGYGILPRERVAFSEPTIAGLAFASKYCKPVLIYDLDGTH
uniref:N-acetyltransferase ESCO2 n=1 Tax=Ascaris suum TaxID=6253 RepID=F1LCG8_ASCSU